MKKILIKFLIILITIIITNNITFNTISYAGSLSEIIQEGDEFMTKGSGTAIDESKLKETSSDIYNILFTIGVILSFAIGMIIGIQFIIGSADEKAKVKETLVPYAIGVFVIFSAFTIWKIVVGIGNEVTPTAYSNNTKNDYKYVYKV